MKLFLKPRVKHLVVHVYEVFWKHPIVFISCVMYLTFTFLVLTLAVPLKSSPRSTLKLMSQRSVIVPKPNHYKGGVIEGRKIKPPDHLDAVKIERDGHINKEFHKEVMLGENEVPNQNPVAVLTEVFHKADTSNDSLLTKDELSAWITIKVTEHLNQAMRENFFIFTAIDTNPRNGMISWKEYHSHFLKRSGFNEEYVQNHKNHKDLPRHVKESIMRDKAAWSEAARSDPDNLNIDEFLSFRHPEVSHSTLLSMVEEVILKLDGDGDEILTEDEFSNIPTENENNEDETSRRLITVEERRKEYRELIDKDHDGKVGRKELLMYIDPRNPRHARDESETLIVLADTNRDGMLSLSEILDKPDLFIGSKMVNTAQSFHDEF